MMFKSNEFRMIEYKELVSDSFILIIQNKGKGREHMFIRY